MKKIFSLALVSMMTLSACADSNCKAEVGGTTGNTNDGTDSKVYFTKEITPESLVRVYEALGVSAEGKRVAVKISTGESSRTNYLRPEFIKNLVQKLGANLVECNTAYGGTRGSTAAHRRVIAERGFDDITTVDIMDEEGEIQLPVTDTRHGRIWRRIEESVHRHGIEQRQTIHPLGRTEHHAVDERRPGRFSGVDGSSRAGRA